MENPSFVEDELNILPTRFSAISAANIAAETKEKSSSKLNYSVYFTFLMLGMGSFRVSTMIFVDISILLFHVSCFSKIIMNV